MKMKDRTLETIFIVLDDARENGKITQEEVSEAMVLLAVDIPQVEQEPRDHVAMLHVQGELTNIYGPMTESDTDQFIQTALTNWGSNSPSVLMSKWPLTSPALGNASSVSPSTPLGTEELKAMEDL